MQVAIISDIHGNLPALTALLPALRQVDRVLFLGDATGYYCQVNEVIDVLRTLPLITVLGNHDDYVLNGCPTTVNTAVKFGVEWAQKVITTENRAWLAAQPLCWGGCLDGHSMLLVHGSPWRPLTEYLYQDNPSLRKLQDFSYDVIAFGHTHRALWQAENQTKLINPGSVGQARDECGVACAVLMDMTSFKIHRLRVPYATTSVIRYAQKCGAGDWIYKHLI